MTTTSAFDAELSFLAGVGEMSERTRSLDWSRTALSSPADWPRSLKTAVGLMLGSRYAMFIWWGREHINLYNDAYRPFLGGKHPRALGQPAREAWAEIWDLVGPRADAVLQRGESTFDDALLLIMDRHGYQEETYFTFSYSPIHDDRGDVGGLFCAVTEETQRVIGERRLRLLREVAANVATTTVPTRVCIAAAGCMAQSNRDLPFTLLYLCEPESRVAHLAAHTGIEATWPGAVETLSLEDSHGPWPLARAAASEDLILLDDLPRHFGDLPRGAWDRAPERAIVIPLKAAGRGGHTGFLVAGLNPYLPFDEDYRGFLSLLAGQIAAGVGNAQAHEQERRRAEALAEIDRVKTTFFSNVSHEFRTPLTLMLGPLADALATQETPAPVRAHLELAERNAQRLLKLVNSLLDFSRIEAGRIQASFAPLDLAALTTDLASTFRSAMQRAQLHYEVSCDPLDVPVYVDREMWEKIVLNLLSNAFKFTLQGSVRVRLTRNAHEALLEVSDSGVGVPEHELPRLFDRFHRVEGTPARTHEGSGIGLALVQELVKLHGGSIEAHSVLGFGSRFVVHLPLGSAHIPSERMRSEPSLPSTATVARTYVQEALRWLPEEGSQAIAVASDGHDLHTPRFASTFGSRVLLADDNADMRSYVRELLSPWYDVETVADGTQALAAARRQRPDLILSDVMMPPLDGFALLKALRADHNLLDVPVILLSARAGEEQRIEGLGAGADDYLSKPFHARELLARMGSLLELTALRRESEERFRAYVQASSDVVYRMNADWTEMRSLEGRDFIADQTDPSRSWLEKYILEDDRPQVLAAIDTAITTRRMFELEHRVIRADGSVGWTYSRAVPLFGDTGEILEWFGAATDVTVRREARDMQQEAEAIVREERRSLEILNHAGATLAVETDLHRLVQIVTDAGVELTGAQFGAFFYNVEDAQGESYMLYTLSGVPAEAFAKFPMPRNTEVFAPTFSGAGIVRSDDITQDPRYGRNSPRRGMPEGHLPVRSYLAVPVLSRDGKVLGGLFFGHATVGVFTEHSERGLTGLAAQAAVAIDNANLARATQQEIAERARAEEALRELNSNLEHQILERTEQLRHQEEALRQAQKMEAVGQLTGGVAHDFNNLLQVIVGNLELIRRLAPADSGRIQRAAEQAMNGAMQASSLTQRLLAFSRRQPLDPKPTNINSLIGGMSDLLARSLGETIAVETVRGAGVWQVEVDPNALESALLNLAVNARDAMPDGGRLTIETMNTHIDEAYAVAHAEVLPGQYVAISVSDTGIGMDAQTLNRAFEPFFTTKPVGKGTGLGLSQVYGFAKQSGGHIKIYSEAGQGTTVKIYLPRLQQAIEASTPAQLAPIPEGSADEIILVLEDDPSVRAYSVDALRDLGYRIIEAHDGPTALQLLATHEQVDLLFTDVVLPGGMTGAQVAAKARELHPTLKVLFTTGYARNAIVHHGRLDKGVQLITKPFSFRDLAAKVRDVLDGLQR